MQKTSIAYNEKLLPNLNEGVQKVSKAKSGKLLAKVEEISAVKNC